jgi:hypothetical protein
VTYIETYISITYRIYIYIYIYALFVRLLTDFSCQTPLLWYVERSEEREEERGREGEREREGGREGERERKSGRGTRPTNAQICLALSVIISTLFLLIGE